MTAPRAPVALFIHRRPEHTRRTLETLAANHGAAETDLIVFADGSRGPQDAAGVAAARAVAAAAAGFRSVEIVARERNFGLADNIADGVSTVMARHGRAIVLEDDIETCAGFLDYMNAALDRYRDAPEVWHVSAWTPRIDPGGLPPHFFWPVMNCWGWASWADRWAAYARAPERLERDWPRAARRRFDLDGAGDFYGQVEDNLSGRIRTWAVFWYATIFEAGGLCLTPAVPLARNIGLDGSGENCGDGGEPPLDLSRPFEGDLPDRIAPHPQAIARARAAIRLSWRSRLSRGLRRRLRRLAARLR